MAASGSFCRNRNISNRAQSSYELQASSGRRSVPRSPTLQGCSAPADAVASSVVRTAAAIAARIRRSLCDRAAGRDTSRARSSWRASQWLPHRVLPASVGERRKLFVVRPGGLAGDCQNRTRKDQSSHEGLAERVEFELTIRFGAVAPTASVGALMLKDA